MSKKVSGWPLIVPRELPVEPEYVIPEITEQDMGKVLTAGEGEPVWADAPSGLPEITNADEGKVLTVVEDDSGETSVYKAEWAEPSGGGDVYQITEDETLGFIIADGTAMMADIEAGKNVIAVLLYAPYTFYYHPLTVVASGTVGVYMRGVDLNAQTPSFSTESTVEFRYNSETGYLVLHVG